MSNIAETPVEEWLALEAAREVDNRERLQEDYNCPMMEEVEKYLRNESFVYTGHHEKMMDEIVSGLIEKADAERLSLSELLDRSYPTTLTTQKHIIAK